MIKTKEGTTKIKGTEAEIRADLAVILAAAREAFAEKRSLEEADAFIDEALMRSRMKNEDVLFGTLEEISKILNLALDELKAKGVEADEEECDCCECNVDCAEAGCKEDGE